MMALNPTLGPRGICAVNHNVSAHITLLREIFFLLNHLTGITPKSPIARVSQVFIVELHVPLREVC